jgi:hypothetical protein
MLYELSDALSALQPEAAWELRHYSDYNTLEWRSPDIPKPTLEEIQNWISAKMLEEPMRLLRLERNKRLTECDWVVIRSYSQNIPVPSEWQVYMQSLRDLPSNSTPTLTPFGKLDLTSVNWPIKPTS